MPSAHAASTDRAQTNFASTLEQMAQQTAQAATTSSENDSPGEMNGESLDGLMKSMLNMPGEEGMDGFVQNVMAHLLSKDVLYPSLKVR